MKDEDAKLFIWNTFYSMGSNFFSSEKQDRNPDAENAVNEKGRAQVIVVLG